MAVIVTTTVGPGEAPIRIVRKKPDQKPITPMMAATQIMRLNRSVSKYAEAAGVIIRATTKMTPATRTPLTTTNEVQTVNMYSTASTGTPIEAAITGSKLVICSGRKNKITAPSTIEVTIANNHNSALETANTLPMIK